MQQFLTPVLVAAISYVPRMRLRLGPLAISPHGVFIAVGFMVGARFMLPQTRKQGIDDETIYPLFTTAALGALVGARLAYVLNHPSDYTSPVAILQVWHGGISLLGGMFGAVLACLPRIRARKLSFWMVMDAAAPAMALGVAIGRTGDLLIADHLGKVTSFALGYRCPAVGIETGSPCAPTQFAARTAGAVVHQTALYDQVLAALLLVALLGLRRIKHFDGFLILVFAAGYGLIRLFEDFLREDALRLGLTASQWTALATVSVCGYVLTTLRRTPRWGNWSGGNGHPTSSSTHDPARDDGRQGPVPPDPSAPGA